MGRVDGVLEVYALRWSSVAGGQDHIMVVREEGKMKCWISGHDWEVIETAFDYDAEYTCSLKVCLKCEKVVDEIIPLRRREEYRRRLKLSRIERAKKIYDESWRKH